MSYFTKSWNHTIERYTRGRPAPLKEAPKIVVSVSTVNLVKRCAVHLAPILTTVLILVINYHGIYIGQDFTGPIKSETINLLLLQIAAKAHEILIGWSLGLIVFHAVRYELLFGSGLPLGLIGSGLSFSSLEFYFRPEFCAAVKYWFNYEKTLRKVAFVVLLVISGLTATLAGPASATLLVPKTQEWPSGGTRYFLNGSSEDFWPANLAGRLDELEQMCNINNSATVATCPAGGFSSLWEHWGRTDARYFGQKDVRNYAKGISGTHDYWPISSPKSQIPPRYVLGNMRNDENLRSTTWLVLPHAAPAAVLEQLTTDWWNAVAPEDHVKPSEIDDRKAFSTYRNAITNTRCASPKILSAADNVVQFPSLAGRFDFAEHLNFTLSNMTFSPTDHLGFRWVHLPSEFGALSIGGLFESPWSNNSSRTVVACSAQSGWVPAQATIDEYSFWTGWYPWNITFGERTPPFNYLAGQALGSTTGRIAMGDTWLNLLTPTTEIKSPTSRNPTPSTIESLFDNAGLGTDFLNSDTNNATQATLLIEAIITSVLVDGISRYNSHRPFAYPYNPDSHSLSPETYSPLLNFPSLILKASAALRTPNIPPTQLTTLSVTMQVTGYSYRPSLAGALAVTVLLTHLIMAIVHIICLLYTGETSGCWSYVSELIALAHNSRSARHGPGVHSVLEGTGAGIHCGTTFGRVGRVVVRSHPDGDTEREQVELVFDEHSDGNRLHERQPAGEVESLALTQRRSRPVAAKSLAQSATWPGASFDERAFASSTDVLVPKSEGWEVCRYGVVKVGHAYS